MRASWVGGLTLALCLGALACDGPGRTIVLGPLPERPTHSPGDEDGGAFDLPDDARPCTTDADCADSIDCTIDMCLPAHYCSNELDNSQCSDGLLCNGVESCDPVRGCIAAAAPSCDDQDACTIDRCDEDAQACVHDPRDFDRDGEVDYHCAGGTDCDDFDAMRGMNAREICGDQVDNDCDQRIDEADCGPIPHDNCSDPLDVSAGGVFEVSTVGALPDHKVNCNTEVSSLDVVFSFHIDEPRDVKLVASGVRDTGKEVTSLSLQTSCGDASSELQCSHGFPGDLRVRALPAGQYSLVVSTTPGVRSVVLNVTFSPATTPPPNQSCESATDVSQGGHFESSFVDVPDTTTSSCSVDDQQDLYYKLTLTQQSDLEVSVTGDESAPPFAVALRKGGCAPDASELRCDLGARVLSHHHELDPGDYVLVLQGPSSHEIGFGLDVSILPPTPPPPGDSCKQVLPLTLGQTQHVSLDGLQKDFSFSSRCPSTGPDAVLSFTLDNPQDIEIAVQTPDDAQAVVVLQTTCGDASTERYCRGGSALQNRLYGLPAGQYFLVVQADTAASVDVRVDASLATSTVAVSGNDTCSTAFDIPLTGGAFQGNTRLLTSNYMAACGGGALSADAAYRLVLPTSKHVTATVDALFDSVLLRYDTSSGMPICQGPETRCIDDSDGSMSRLDEILGPGTYYYIVDGYRSVNDGEYVLFVTISDSP